jgi:DNA modification methylase
MHAVESLSNDTISRGTINIDDTSIRGVQPQQMISLDEINTLIGEKFSIKNWSEKFVGNFLYTPKPRAERHLNYKGETIDMDSRDVNDKQNNHASVKPVALYAYLLKLFNTDKDGTILEPFAGSGTTLVASKLLGMNYFGIEQNEEYYEISKKRLIQDKDYTIKDLESTISNK